MIGEEIWRSRGADSSIIVACPAIHNGMGGAIGGGGGGGGGGGEGGDGDESEEKDGTYTFDVSLLLSIRTALDT